MTKHTTAGSAVTRGTWRHALAWIAAVGLLGSAPQASAIDCPAPEVARGVRSFDQRFDHGRASIILGDCNAWLAAQPNNSIHSVVTEPPYGLVEYSDSEQAKLRSGRGDV